MKDIKTFLFPVSYEIKKHYCNEGGLTHYTVQIVDADFEPFDVEISSDGIEIKTGDYNSICLEPWDIEFLLRAYSQFYKEWSSNDR